MNTNNNTDANINNTSSYMDEDKKQIIKESNYTFRDALEVSAYLIEVGKFERFYKEMQIHDLQKELDEMGDEECFDTDEREEREIDPRWAGLKNLQLEDN